MITLADGSTLILPGVTDINASFFPDCLLGSTTFLANYFLDSAHGTGRRDCRIHRELIGCWSGAAWREGPRPFARSAASPLRVNGDIGAWGMLPIRDCGG